MQMDGEDYLQGVAFDYYGSRMAVCSSDRKIKIFDLNSREEWEQTATWEVREI